MEGPTHQKCIFFTQKSEFFFHKESSIKSGKELTKLGCQILKIFEKGNYFISVDSSGTGQLCHQATCYVYVLWLRSLVLKLSDASRITWCVASFGGVMLCVLYLASASCHMGCFMTCWVLCHVTDIASCVTSLCRSRQRNVHSTRRMAHSM